jgi:tetraacyldisaccharide 4'-kinase
MIQHTLVRILLAPLALLYGLGVSLRNWFYKIGLLKSVGFSVPVIAVGNLSVGGSGKSPHIEYLVRFLSEYLEVGTLSRGYGRKSRGYLEILPDMQASDAGDEPLQFKKKFPRIVVSVGESRSLAIPRMLMYHPELKVILLDDAFQHLAVKPGLNILLTPYDRPFTRDYLLPAGRLREWRNAYERADVVVVSKCPPELAAADAQRMREEIRPLAHQQLFFSTYRYGNPFYIFNPGYTVDISSDWSVLLICAIAGTDYLLRYLDEVATGVQVLEYEDHHFFSNYDIANLKQVFDRLDAPRKMILTTEKDAMRLYMHKDFIVRHQLPVFVLPIQVEFLFQEGDKFEDLLKTYLLNFRA